MNVSSRASEGRVVLSIGFSSQSSGASAEESSLVLAVATMAVEEQGGQLLTHTEGQNARLEIRIPVGDAFVAAEYYSTTIIGLPSGLCRPGCSCGAARCCSPGSSGCAGRRRVDVVLEDEHAAGCAVAPRARADGRHLRDRESERETEREGRTAARTLALAYEQSRRASRPWP